MIFHIPDTTFKRLASCWKRASSLGKEGKIDLNHRMATPWYNILMAMDDEVDIVLMDWFALKLEVYSETHLLSNDETIAALLYEWKKLMPFNPTRLVK